MWRAGGKGEVYTYLPQTAANDAACSASGAGAYCKDAAYGLSFGRGNFYWNAGGWNTIEERVRLNTPGQADGTFAPSAGRQLSNSMLTLPLPSLSRQARSP